MSANSIGKRLRWARRRAGMTQQDLAGRVNMPQPNIARIERGAVSPRLATLVELLAATGHQLTVEPIGPEVDREALQRRRRMSVPQRTRSAIGPAARDPAKTPIRIVRRLRRFNVPFVLVGALAEVAHGAPISELRVVEVCHADTDVARERIGMARDDLGPLADSRRLRLITQTRAGDSYDVLVRNAVTMPVDGGVLARVASLDDLIRDRLAGGTPEDLEAAAALRAIAEYEPPPLSD